MRALDQEVVDVVWQAVEPLLPPPAETHPLGCRPRKADSVVVGEIGASLNGASARPRSATRWSSRAGESLAGSS
jgi:transposase